MSLSSERPEPSGNGCVVGADDHVQLARSDVAVESVSVAVSAGGCSVNDDGGGDATGGGGGEMRKLTAKQKHAERKARKAEAPTTVVSKADADLERATGGHACGTCGEMFATRNQREQQWFDCVRCLAHSHRVVACGSVHACYGNESRTCAGRCVEAAAAEAVLRGRSGQRKRRR